MTDTRVETFLQAVREIVERSGRFGTVEVQEGMLRCAARDVGAQAWYRLCSEDGHWYVELVTPDRWLSESIEADLMHHGDPIEELLEEELVELGDTSGPPPVQHFRSDDMLYTFRTPVEVTGALEGDAEAAATMLMAYEATFRELGDMSAGAKED